MKEHPSYEPNCGLSLGKEPCELSSPGPQCAETIHVFTGMVPAAERREETPCWQVTRTFWQEVKEQTDVVGH